MTILAPVYEQDYRIYLEDTDAGGIVYHANHLKLLERCRRDWLRGLGMSGYFYATYSAEATRQLTENAELHFVVSDLSIRYFQPILLDSLVKVTVTSYQVKSASLVLVQQIFDNDTLLVCANITLACVKSAKLPDGKSHIQPTRLPKDFLALLKN